MSWDSGLTSYTYNVLLPPKQAILEVYEVDL